MTRIKRALGFLKTGALFFALASWSSYFASAREFLDTAASPESASLAETPEPAVENPSALKRLDVKDPIWVTPDRTKVVLLGTICLREGLLEFFACRAQSKEHESIVSIDVKPYLIHAALLVIGAKKGEPARFDPEFVPPSGEEIEVHVLWKEKDGTIRDYRAQELVRESKSGELMKSPFVFTGGVMGKNKEGKPYYLADITGEVFGVSNFAGSILDVPFESSSSNDALYYEPNPENIPEVGTVVTLTLSRVKKEE